jgi:hypothetical protein
MEAPEQPLSKQKDPIRRSPLRYLIAIILTIFLIWVALFIHSRAGFTLTVVQPTATEELLAMLAKDLNIPQFCEKIRPNAGSEMLFSGATASSLRSQCFYAIAVKTKDMTLCAQVKPLSTLFYGYSESGGYCRSDIQRGRRDDISIPTPSPEFFASFMKQLGYTDEFIAVSLEPGNHLDHIIADNYSDYYSMHILFGYGQDDLNARNDFVKKVLNAFSN